VEEESVVKKSAGILTGMVVMTMVASAQEKATRKAPQNKIPANVTVHRDVAYTENPHERQKLDLFVPKDAQKPLPLLIWIHGGAWLAGSKEGCPLVNHTQRGYVVASINYRLSKHAIFPAQLEDCQAAIRFLRKNADKYMIDPKRIGLAGASAGGHLVSLVGCVGSQTRGKPDDVSVSAVVDYFGPSNFLTIASQSKADSQLNHAADDSPEALLIGGPIQANQSKAKEVSPVTHVTKEAPAHLILHGDRDTVVPVEQSEELHAKLKEAGAHSELLVIKGGGHGPGVFTPEYNKKVSEFFDTHVKNGSKKP
jgi:acetyl esterase/lipase